MPHLKSTSVRTFQMHGVQFHSYASSLSGASQLAAWRVDIAPGTAGQPHHMSHEEILHVLDGDLHVEVDAESFNARAGDAILVPAGARFLVSNKTPRPAHAWVTTHLGMTATMSDTDDPITPPWAQ